MRCRGIPGLQRLATAEALQVARYYYQALPMLIRETVIFQPCLFVRLFPFKIRHFTTSFNTKL